MLLNGKKINEQNNEIYRGSHAGSAYSNSHLPMKSIRQPFFAKGFETFAKEAPSFYKPIGWTF